MVRTENKRIDPKRKKITRLQVTLSLCEQSPDLYVLEKFVMAVNSLATGPGKVQDRLIDAYLDIHVIRLVQMPKELRDDFRWVTEMLTRREPRYRGQGRLYASLARMRNRTGVTIAQRIVYIKEKLETLCRSG